MNARYCFECSEFRQEGRMLDKPSRCSMFNKPVSPFDRGCYMFGYREDDDVHDRHRDNWS